MEALVESNHLDGPIVTQSLPGSPPFVALLIDGPPCITCSSHLYEITHLPATTQPWHAGGVRGAAHVCGAARVVRRPDADMGVGHAGAAGSRGAG
jgi:hypothetical protein